MTAGGPASPVTPPDPEPGSPWEQEEQADLAEDRYTNWLRGGRDDEPR